MKLAPIMLFLGVASLACALTDVKGDSCPSGEIFETAEGDRYCLDEGAPAECEDGVAVITEACKGSVLAEE